jgi:hypothetical protein
MAHELRVRNGEERKLNIQDPTIYLLTTRDADKSPAIQLSSEGRELGVLGKYPLENVLLESFGLNNSKSPTMW